MKKLLFIMNPNAGVRRANRFLTEILTVFNRADYDVQVSITAGPGDAAKTAARLVEHFGADTLLIMERQPESISSA